MDVDAARKAMSDHRIHGRPDVALKIKVALEDGRDVDLKTGLTVAQTVEVAGIEQPPPERGPGSGAAVWREWAVRVAEMDETVVNGLKKGDLIDVLREDGFID